ncbi:tRNA lysidine(34) synthetase TilS [Chthonobacter albigriseus]|uniref:tRNA lysidine(34) synthetase TilS n=1 Tax=Chthonobacter albigriseus TaxID=1683161 RepID=UPI0015EED178|nr:tRNA lysidine(34) synthetase TilS [Chthonobacter albigriseus]
MAARPFDDDELPLLFSDLASLHAIGVAVSGGPDSTALLLLLHRWASLSGRPRLHVLTVDHGLRPASAGECAAVADLAASLDLPCTILRWTHDGAPPVSDLQARAREARYALLSEAARQMGLDAVALAHTADDQAETVLMRLARGSGVWGLAGMARERSFNGVRFVRPLLGERKARLVATCRAAGVAFAEDPLNDADRFLRVRTRKLIPVLADIGLDVERLTETAARLARAAAALDTMVETVRRLSLTDHGGVLAIDLDRLEAAPDEIALRLLSDAIRTVRPKAYSPRLAPIEAFWRGLSGGQPRRATIAGVTLDPRGRRLWLYAEAGRTGFPEMMIDRCGTFVWDGRFAVEVTTSPKSGIMVRSAAGDERRPDLPKAAASTLPVACHPETGEPAEGVNLRALDAPNWES